MSRLNHEQEEYIHAIAKELVTASHMANDEKISKNFAYVRDEIRQHNELLAVLDKRIALIEQTLDATLEQAKKTNNRVNALEMWRSAIIGAIGIITFLGLPNIIQVVAES